VDAKSLSITVEVRPDSPRGNSVAIRATRSFGNGGSARKGINTTKNKKNEE